MSCISTRTSSTARPGVLASGELAAGPTTLSRPLDWSDQALARTWRTVGTVSMGIGIINAFLPLLPTTVFLLIGVWAYGKGDPQLRERLLNHPRFGHPLRLWVEKRQISRKGKLGAILGIGLSGAFTAAMVGPKLITWAVLGGLGALCAYLLTRSEPTAA